MRLPRGSPMTSDERVQCQTQVVSVRVSSDVLRHYRVPDLTAVSPVDR